MSSLGFNTFGEALRAARQIRRYTQQELAALTGLGWATVQRHELGGEAKTSQIERYAQVLDVRFTFGAGEDDAPAVGLEPTTYRFTDASTQGSAA